MTVTEKSPDAKQLAYGKTIECILPSGFKAVIREQNGNDEDILSNAAASRDTSNINNYICAVVVETDLPFAIGKRLTSAVVGKLILRDKYFIMLMSRIHSLGEKLSFPMAWNDRPEEPDTYVEDLNNYVWDYSKPMPEKDSPDYFEYRIKPLPQGAYDKVEFETSSGKLIRFNLLNVSGEIKVLLLPENEQTVNSEIKARNLEINVDGKWSAVDNFAVFTRKDMAEIRKIISEVDPALQLLTEVENPRIPTQKQKFPIIGFRDFFFPEEI